MDQTLVGQLTDLKNSLTRIISNNQETDATGDLDDLMYDLEMALDKANSIEERLGKIYAELG